MDEEISKEDAMSIVRGKTFTYKTKFKVIAILAALVLCPLFLWAIYNVWSNYLLKGGNIYALVALTVFVLIPMLFLGPMGVIDAFRRKIKISETEFFARGLFKTKIITFDKIKKFRIQEHQYGYELLLLDANESEQLKISSYIGNIDLIFYFCSVYFENLDATELEHERQTILNDSSYGYTVEQKEENIQKVKKIAKIGSILGYGIWGLWIANQLFLKQEVIFDLVVYGILLIPLFYLFYTFINKKFISTNVGKSQLADTTVPILLPACLGLVLFVSTEYMDYTKLWMPVSFCTAIILFLFYKSGMTLFDKKKNPPILLKVFLVATAIVLTAGVSYTYITILNTYFDRSTVVWHQSKIIEKTKTTGKTSSWYIKVEKWGTFDDPKKHKISREKWNHLTEGDLVQIGVSSGFLGFPWISHIEKNQ